MSSVIETGVKPTMTISIIIFFRITKVIQFKHMDGSDVHLYMCEMSLKPIDCLKSLFLLNIQHNPESFTRLVRPELIDEMMHMYEEQR